MAAAAGPEQEQWFEGRREEGGEGRGEGEKAREGKGREESYPKAYLLLCFRRHAGEMSGNVLHQSMQLLQRRAGVRGRV